MKRERNILPTPSEMIRWLDRFVRGQTRAKQDLAVAVYNHYISQGWREKSGEDLGRHHLLMIGPTGVGKTYMVKTLADYLQVPVGFASATGLVEAGYKGSSVDSIVKGLLDRVGGDARKAEKGIIFLDEIDKIKRGDTGMRDVSGEGVQNALLTLLDGQVTRGMDGSAHAAIDTSKLLFICTGAFVGLDSIVGKRMASHQPRIGFHARPNEKLADVPDSASYTRLCEAETADLVAFGMIPEFIGRFATVTVLHELSRHDLREIVSESTNHSALARQAKLAELHGIKLEFSDEALEILTEEAVALGTGARGLHRLIGRAVDPVDHRWPELASEGITKVIITRACAEGLGEPELISEKSGFKRLDRTIRRECLKGLPKTPEMKSRSRNSSTQPVPDDSSLTDTTGWDADDFRKAAESVRNEFLNYGECTGSAKKWWDEFERENANRPQLIFRLIDELRVRRATINEFYLAYIYSNTDNIQANLYYFDYLKLKNEDADEGREDNDNQPDKN